MLPNLLITETTNQLGMKLFTSQPFWLFRLYSRGTWMCMHPSCQVSLPPQVQDDKSCWSLSKNRDITDLRNRMRPLVVNLPKKKHEVTPSPKTIQPLQSVQGVASSSIQGVDSINACAPTPPESTCKNWMVFLRLELRCVFFPGISISNTYKGLKQQGFKHHT